VSYSKYTNYNLSSIFGYTGVCEAESPQSQVGRRVRDTAKAVLNRVDRLMDYNVAHVKLTHNTQQLYHTCAGPDLAGGRPGASDCFNVLY